MTPSKASVRAPTIRPAKTKATRRQGRDERSGALLVRPAGSDAGDATAERRDRHRDPEQEQGKRDESMVCCFESSQIEVRERIDDRDLAHEQDPRATSPPDEAADEALDHERPADEPVGGADELHHLDLAAAGVDREADRVADQQQRGDQQQRRDHDQEDLQGAGDLADLARVLAGVKTSSMIGLIGFGLPFGTRRRDAPR